MTPARQAFDKLPSDGRYQCPDCGLSGTTPYGGCGCPLSPRGFKTHINLWHHDCTLAMREARKSGPPGWRSLRFTKCLPAEYLLDGRSAVKDI